MTTSAALEPILGQVLSPLANEVGEDLSQTVSPDLTLIRNKFNDPRQDFGAMLEVGRKVLAEQSKDMWALWAFNGGILWSKQFDVAEGFAASTESVASFCEKYWDGCFPRELRLRNTLLAGIVKWWNGYTSREAASAPKEWIAEAAANVSRLCDFLVAKVGGGDERQAGQQLPILAGLKQLRLTLEAATRPAASPGGNGAASAEAPHAKAESEDAEEVAEEAPAAKGPTVGLDAAFRQALKRLERGERAEALSEFQRCLDGQGEFAAQFRGQVLLGELYLKAGLATHAKRVLQHAHDQIEKIRLPQWEPRLCSRLWTALIDAHQRIAGEEKPDGKLLSELFAQICRLDPARAAALEAVRDK